MIYAEISKAEIPKGVRFDVPRYAQGADCGMRVWDLWKKRGRRVCAVIAYDHHTIYAILEAQARC